MLVCIFGYLFAGLVKIWWISTGVSIIALLIVLTIMKKINADKPEDAGKNTEAVNA